MRLRLALLAFVGAAVLAPASAGQVELPAPLPAVPTPALPALPAVPGAPVPSAPAPTAQPSLPSAPVPAAAPSTSSPPVSGATGATSTQGGEGVSGSTSSGATGTRAKRPARRASIVLAFSAPSARRLALPVIQVSPRCERAGVLRLRASAGANRFRFDGRIGRRRLADGTYVVETPTRSIRFAVVDGKPTRQPRRLEPSVCPAGGPDAAGAGAFAARGEGAVAGAAAAGLVRTGAEPPTPHPRRGLVLGTAFAEAAEAALGLHPVFYALLAAAILVLAAATLPAAVVPHPSTGAALARRRAELTLAGTIAVVAVIVAYLLALA